MTIEVSDTAIEAALEAAYGEYLLNSYGDYISRRDLAEVVAAYAQAMIDNIRPDQPGFQATSDILACIRNKSLVLAGRIDL